MPPVEMKLNLFNDASGAGMCDFMDLCLKLVEILMQILVAGGTLALAGTTWVSNKELKKLGRSNLVVTQEIIRDYKIPGDHVNLKINPSCNLFVTNEGNNPALITNFEVRQYNLSTQNEPSSYVSLEPFVKFLSGGQQRVFLRTIDFEHDTFIDYIISFRDEVTGEENHLQEVIRIFLWIDKEPIINRFPPNIFEAIKKGNKGESE